MRTRCSRKRIATKRGQERNRKDVGPKKVNRNPDHKELDGDGEGEE